MGKAMNMLAFLLLIMLTVHGIEGKEDNVHPESAAPNCSNRCHGCNPCKPVLVTVPSEVKGQLVITSLRSGCALVVENTIIPDLQHCNQDMEDREGEMRVTIISHN